MYYPDVTATINNACLSAFAEPFTLKASGGDVVLQGVFDEQAQPEGIGSVGFTDRSHTLNVLQSVVDSNQITVKQVVVVRGVNYSILEIVDDLGGMAVFSLRRYS